MVISHGRAGDAAGRQLGARARRRPAISPTPVSSWPCRCGWATAPPAVPTWKTAARGDRRFTPMFNRAASEIAQVIEAMARRPDVDPANVVALGQSVGGGSTVALAAARPAGARRHQFRGRLGRRSGQVAGQALRTRALAGNLCRLRRDHHAHALDLYRERPVLGPEWPGRWAEAYNAAGGHARFERLGPDGANGHSLFTHAPEMETAGARLPARAGLRHAGAGRGIRPGAPSLNGDADGRAPVRPPCCVRPRRRWRAAPGR